MKHIDEIFGTILTLITAGLAHIIGEIHIAVHATNLLHYALSTAQGLMYISSFAVGALTIYKHFKSNKHGAK